MRKINFIFLSLLLFLFSNVSAQSSDWEYQTNDNLFRYKLFSNKVLLVHGESDGKKVVASKRIFPSITALDKVTGKEIWTIERPIDMMGVSKKEKNLGSVKVKIRSVKEGTDYIRFGDLLVVDSKDGKVIFNPTEAGITEILYSKIFPEGILATATLNNEKVHLFISFNTWKIAWVKNDIIKSKASRKVENFLVKLATRDAKGKQQANNKLGQSNFYNGSYIDGNYLTLSETSLENFKIKTGVENWKYTSKKFIKQYTSSKDTITGETIIYLNTLSSSNKSSITALNYETGDILWEKNLKYTVDKLKIVDKKLSVLAIPKTNVFGKRYYQIYDKKGNSVLEEKGLKAFGNSLENIFIDNDQVIIVTESGQSASSKSLSSSFGSFSLNKKAAAKTPKFINSINLKTKEFLFKKRIKTNDKVKYVQKLKKGLFILEENQAYVLNDVSGKKISRDIKSKGKLTHIEDQNNIYVATRDNPKLYAIDKNMGTTKELIDLKKLKMKFVYELILTNEGIVTYGINKKNDLFLVKTTFKGDVIYNKSFSTSNFKKSWNLPIVENKLYMFIEIVKDTEGIGVFDLTTGELINNFSHRIDIEGKLVKNTGNYFVDKTGIIYNTPQIKRNLLDKKTKSYNNRGLIVKKQL